LLYFLYSLIDNDSTLLIILRTCPDRRCFPIAIIYGAQSILLIAWKLTCWACDHLVCPRDVKKYAHADGRFVFFIGDVLLQSMRKFAVNRLYRRPFPSNDGQSIMEILGLSPCCLCQRFTVSERRTNRKSVKRKQFYKVNWTRKYPLQNVYTGHFFVQVVCLL